MLLTVKEAVSTSLTRFWTSLLSMWSLILMFSSPVMASLHLIFHLVETWVRCSSASIIIIIKGADLNT